MPEVTAKAIIQIAHGMAEHSERYEDFAIKLTQNSYGVYINDHIGHGKTAKNQKDLGHLPKDGFNLCVENLLVLTKIIKKENPGVPVVLLGHSMGSALAHDYITQYGKEINGCIISGSSGIQDIYPIASLVSTVVVMIQGRKTRSRLMDRLSFGSFNNKFKPARTKFEWLSKDTAKIDKYINDPFCGFVCTAGFYYEYFKALNKLFNYEKIKNIPLQFPIYIFSGENDPVGKYTKAVKKLINMYLNSGLKNVEYKLYPKGRHEMLNETNREEVIKDLIEWIGKKV